MLTTEDMSHMTHYEVISKEADRLIAEGWFKNFDKITTLYHLMKGCHIVADMKAFSPCDKCHIPICCAIEGHCDRQGNGYR